MTRTALGTTTLAVLALVFAFSGTVASAGDDEINFNEWSSSHPSAQRSAQFQQEMEYLKHDKWMTSKKRKSPEGLTAKKGTKESSGGSDAKLNSIRNMRN